MSLYYYMVIWLCASVENLIGCCVGDLALVNDCACLCVRVWNCLYV